MSFLLSPNASSPHSSGARIRVRACALGMLHGKEGRKWSSNLGKMAFCKLSEALLWCSQTLFALLSGSFVPFSSEVVANYPFSSPFCTPLLLRKKNLTSGFTETLREGNYGVTIHALWR